MQDSRQITAVIFDCDGVLVDSEPLHYQAFQRVLEPLGLAHDYQDYLAHYIGFDDRDAFMAVFQNARKSLQQDQLRGLLAAKEEALRHILGEGISSFPGVVALVRELASSNVPLAVASGALRQEVDRFLEALGLSAAFPIRVTADYVKHSKPDPESYLMALQQLQHDFALGDIDPRTCIAIEDTPAGLQSAKKAGLFTIAVAHTYPREQLSEADYVLENFIDVTVAKLIEICTAD